MARYLQSALDKWYLLRHTIISILTYLTMRLYGLEVTFQHVTRGAYAVANHSPLSLDSAGDLDALLAHAQGLVASAEQRRAFVADKCKTLLTLGSLLLGAMGIILPKYLAFESWWLKGPAILALLALFDGLVLLLVFFDVRSDAALSLTQNDVSLDAVNLKKSLINETVECASNIDMRTNYLVDVFRSARFCILAVLVIVGALVVWTVAANAEVDAARQVVREIRSDAELVELLRGPKGDRGETGSIGPIGPPGEKGATGNSLTAKELAQALLSDQKFISDFSGALAHPQH